ncbi:MAG: PD-(D/E)XK nuclease family protein [Myxococcaceae bacterium]|nr:PD-(D/E)XK nuclease family protein [Myxococcaceae bacterium]
MRRLRFDESFDGGVYFGHVPGTATAGESWLGPLGTLGMFESLLGLTHRAVGAGVRVGQALRGLTETPGFWTRSLEADGLATARELLRWSDTLRLQGWTGQGGPRLEALARALRSVDPGPAERLRKAITRLDEFKDVRWGLETFAARESLPRLWREALDAAAVESRAVTLQPSPRTAPTLEAARGTGFEPVHGERALQLIRPHGPVTGADAVAAALAATRSTRTLIIGSDPILDAALRRHGLPTTGAGQDSHDNVLGELLPLVIELGVAPADPQRALELLTIPQGLIRPRVASELRRALEQWPAIGSQAWKDAITRLLPELEDDEARQTLTERLQAVFGDTVPSGGSYPTKVLLARARWLQQWLHARLSRETSEESQARLQAVVGQVALFTNLVERSAVDALRMTQVRRFLEEAHDGMPAASAFPAQAGLWSVRNPGGVVAPVERIVWWNYTRSSVPVPRTLALLAEEHAALAAVGVFLPTTSEQALHRARAAERPFLMATEALWLVCPQHEPNGDHAAPHPSWDAIAARAKTPQLVARLVTQEPRLDAPLVKKQRTQLVLPAPVLEWTLPAKLERREQESPSSAEALVGCSLNWVLRYRARMWSGASATLSLDDRMLGTLAHHILLERTLKVPHVSAAAASEAAAKALLEEGPSLVAQLFLPGASAELGAAKQVLQKAAAVLHQLVTSGWKVVSTEERVVGDALGAKFGGISDLVVERNGRRAVIDLKWGGQKYRRQSLVEGTAVQLSAYAELLRQQGFQDPAIGYFIITTASLLSADGGLAPGAGKLTTQHGPAQTWGRFEQLHRKAWQALDRKKAHAPGVLPEDLVPETGVTDDGELVVGPGCRFCEYDGICGARYGSVEVPHGQD